MTRIMLAAGGTGGHLFPAEALAAELVAKGHQVFLMTDRRGARIGTGDASCPRHAIVAGGIAGKTLSERLRNLARLLVGFIQSLAVALRRRPELAVGFGGYVSFPPLLAARLTGARLVLHEQNAIMGRANRMLARWTSGTAFGFASRAMPANARVIGNPVRPAILALGAESYAASEEEVHLLVTGGSQGARAFATLVPEAIALLPERLRARLVIAQQCRADDLDSVGERYRMLGQHRVTLAPFFSDMPERLRWAHLVICRAGASSLSELAVAGRPAIAIPLPGSIDGHQDANAQSFAEAGALMICREKEGAPALARALEDYIGEPGRLAKKAEAMRSLARPQAARELAAFALSHLRGGT
ncbi:MAG TPA: undecaprenyldiphospho-muramoylpentapeptide beta-N-acetylglucosaminyltransferase [Dongiaceae bacterium]|jgi:UDP-N-acetylglucosamine--N-acetylmuramyl-(pentapeptide) pyrophosphoryl-undecaprenol N-acetylglucosamine transferase|nr:undecaprenyldiphospho-muramoylpentapeptide beta-N-acetylglucosaminyltransferase [Dongiaceae bacterium]